MALTISNAGSNQSTTSSASLTLTPSVNFAAGDMAVLVLAADNAGTNGASSVSGVSDNQGNTWTSRIDATRDPGAAGEGVTLVVWTMTAGTLGTGDTITVAFSPNTTSKAMHLYRVEGDATVTYVTASSSTGTMPVAETTGTLTVGDAVFGVLGLEGNVALTFDSDTLNGNWSTAQNTLANTGTGNTSVRAASQWKVVTGTDAQTWNVTAGGQDRASGTLILRDVVTVVTGTAVGTWGAWSATATGAVVFVVPDGPYAVTARVDGSSTVRTTDDGQTAVTPRTDGSTTTRPTDDGASSVAARIDGSTTAREAP